jgi:hypothetical protein
LVPFILAERGQYFGTGTEVFLPRGPCHPVRPSPNIAARDRPQGLVKLRVDMKYSQALEVAIRATPHVGITAVTR